MFLEAPPVSWETLTIVVSTAASAFLAATWLSKQLSNTRSALYNKLESVQTTGERRHRQNLVNFTKIFEKLKLGDAGDINGDNTRDYDGN